MPLSSIFFLCFLKEKKEEKQESDESELKPDCSLSRVRERERESSTVCRDSLLVAVAQDECAELSIEPKCI